MKQLLSSLLLGLAVLPLAGCVELDQALMGGGGGYGPGYNSGYNPGYGPRPTPRPYYNGGYDHDDHHHDSNRNYYGGEHAWYEAGVGIGKKDRRAHVSANYRRHKTQYDGRTESQFARGYNDGYYR